jgi:ATP-dependent Clp protease adaptor protein ClpS
MSEGRMTRSDATVRLLFVAAANPEKSFPRRAKSPYHRLRHAPSLAQARMSGNGKNGNEEGPGTGVIVKAKPKTKKPAMYKVLMLNDDYTPMEFVVHILERFFNKNRQEATRIMLHVHRRGVGICGVYTYEVAETKVTQVMDFARQHQHPLQCTLEKD